MGARALGAGVAGTPADEAKGVGRRLEGAGDYAGALRVYDEALRREPSLSDLWSARAGVLMRLRRIDEALTSSGEALRLNPCRAFLYKDHGQILFRMGQREEALGFFRRAVEIDPQRPGLRLHLAQALVQLERWEEARREALRAVEVARSRPDPHLYGKLTSAGRILQLAGFPADALAMFREAQALRPNRRGLERFMAAAGGGPASQGLA